MAPVPASVVRQAELLDANGKKYFEKRRFLAAVDAHTEAITLCPDVALYWANRAICYTKLNQWTKVEADSRKALELDSRSTKAHFMLGLTLVERQEYAEGIKELEKALNIEGLINPKSDMVMEIKQSLFEAKYNEWELLSSKREWMLQNLKDSCEKALTEYHFLHDSQDDYGPKEAENDVVGQLRVLNEVFSKTASVDTPTEDPVIAPSGITYERAMIIKHLQKVGNFDPITREPLEQHQLVPNLAIKEAVQAYLNDHPWAYGARL
ncbi:E3 ubiquitin-protein ligase CHIP-like isoform X2 [Musa acuminata AAA Group]|uniref:E3 ubiquitin-protein ligase CHIP isoform X2 n=1 Tax=Musa acuminata AAA Group TaxID=214697 RepID=UPI0031D639DC